MKLIELLSEAKRQLPSNVPPMPTKPKSGVGLFNKPDTDLDQMFADQRERDRIKKIEDAPGTVVMFGIQNGIHYVFWGDNVSWTIDNSKTVNQARRFSPTSEEIVAELNAIIDEIISKKIWLTIEIPQSYATQVGEESITKIMKILERKKQKAINEIGEESITSIDIVNDRPQTAKKTSTSTPQQMPTSVPAVSRDKVVKFRVDSFRLVSQLPAMMFDAVQQGYNRDQLLAEIDDLAADYYGDTQGFAAAVKEFFDSL